jgi:hypothetical protein
VASPGDFKRSLQSLIVISKHNKPNGCNDLSLLIDGQMFFIEFF